MSTTENTQQSWWRETIDAVKDTVLRNGGLFTVFAVVFIIFTGITLVNNPANWWIIAVVVVALFFTVFLFMNARVVIKSILAFCMTTVLASFGFSIGAMADPYSTGAVVWPLAAVFVLFACLTLSYIIPSGRSRWGSAMVAQIVFFSVATIFSIGTGDAILAVIFATILSLFAFSLLHFLTGASRSKREHMPLNVLDDSIRAKFIEGANAAGFHYVDLSDHETDRGAFLVWREKAYLLYPVEMDQKFSIIGKRKTQLGYKARAINAWLLNVVFKETPSWRSRGADIMTVLVDVRSQNGGEAKAIGITLPDTKKLLPVGVMPGRIVQDNTARPEKLFENIDIEFDDFVRQLTPKQQTALGRMKPETEEDHSAEGHQE